MIRKTLNRILGAGAAARTRRGWRCPDETALAALADQRLAEKASERLRRHLANCRYCCNQVAAVVRLQSAEVSGDVPPEWLVRARALAEPKGHNEGIPIFRWGAIAAAAASIALVVALTYRPPEVSRTPPPLQPLPAPTVSPEPSALAPPEPRTVRNSQAASATPQLLYPREGTVVARSGIEFRWKSVPGALSYDIRVVTEDGSMVWEGQAEKARATLPSNVHLTSGESFYVRVRAHLPEGKTVASKLTGFKVKNPS